MLCSEGILPPGRIFSPTPLPTLCASQPLAIGAGVLFPLPVAIPVVLLANLCAATGAFFISRGPGKEFAKRVIRMETHGEEDKEEGGGLMGAVESSVKGSGPVAQGLGVMLLRFSPVTPYSASNYILGLTPIPFVPYIAGESAARQHMDRAPPVLPALLLLDAVAPQEIDLPRRDGTGHAAVGRHSHLSWAGISVPTGGVRPCAGDGGAGEQPERCHVQGGGVFRWGVRRRARRGAV